RPIVLTAHVDAARTRLNALGAAAGAVEVLDPESNAAVPELAAHIAAARERMNERTAARLVRKPLYFGGGLVATGRAEALVAGVARPSRPATEAGPLTIGPAPGLAPPSRLFPLLVPARAGVAPRA